MSELFNEKRVIFTSGKQYRFLLQVKQDLNLSWTSFAKRFKVHQRTLSDWRREKYSLPYSVFQAMSAVAKIQPSSDVMIKNRYWYTKKAGKIAGRLVYQKYGVVGGDPAFRKKRWLEWWERTGRFDRHASFISKAIHIPRKSVDLAEFVGIMIGDGGMSERQITVTLNSKDDSQYSMYVAQLIKKLFKVEPKMSKRKEHTTVTIVVSRTKLVNHCISLGLKKGNKLKQKLDIPEWVKAYRPFSIACVRGMMDTDGCIYNETHRIRNKIYSYPRLSFVSSSEFLRFSTSRILQGLGFMSKIRNNRSVQLEQRKDIINYFQTVGSSNPKHISRYKSFIGGVG